MRYKNKRLLNLLLIFLLVINYPHFIQIAPVRSLAYVQSVPRVSISKYFKEPSFFDQFKKAERTHNFRVLIKLTDTIHVNDLFSCSTNIRTLKSYHGYAVTINKENLLYLLNRGVIKELWNNSILSLPSFENVNSSMHDLISFYPRSLDYQSRTIANFTQMVNATQLWAEGYLGDNTTIAILDTGIANQPNLLKDLTGKNKIIGGWNFLANSTDFSDDNGHGTAIASIIAGSGLGGQIKGVAPNAKLLIGKILDYNGEGTVEALINAIDWAIENGADVINLSLGRVVYSLDPPEVQAVNYAVEKGIIVTVAAGNERATAQFQYNDLYTVLSPGIARKVITVGAVDNNGILYEHSSAGPVAINYNLTTNTYLYNAINTAKTWLKPDVVAPGVMLNVTGLTIDDTRIVSGTSFASAVVAGVCLLLKQKYPSYSPATIKGALLETASKIHVNISDPLGGQINIQPHMFFQGAGLIRAYNASNYLSSPPPFSIWPKSLPMLNDYIFVNTQQEFVFDLFVNVRLHSFYYKISFLFGDIISISCLVQSETGQYDTIVKLDTEFASPGIYKGGITFTGNSYSDRVYLAFTIQRAYGRVLLDSFVDNPEVKYSPYGSLLNFISYSVMTGLLPILPNENSQHSLHLLNLNDFELLLLCNFGGRNKQYNQADIDALQDYLLPGGNYGGGAVVIFPTKYSDFDSLNNLLQPFGINVEPTSKSSEIININVTSMLFSYPYPVKKIFVPNPIRISTTNSSVSSYFNRFAELSLKTANGSELLLLNNLQMDLYTPYLYSFEKNDYDSTLFSFYFLDNALLLRNVISKSREKSVRISIQDLDPEIHETQEVSVVVNMQNFYKPMPGWDLYLTFEQGNYFKPTVVKRYSNVIDYGNGTYEFRFIPEKIGLTPGEYYVRVRCKAGTWDIATGEGDFKNTIYVLAKFSWGPILVETSLVVCIVYLFVFKKKSRIKTKKEDR